MIGIHKMKKYLAIFLGFFILSSQASAWWNDDWVYRKQLQVDITGVENDGDAFPTLIRLSGGNFGYFFDVLPKGEDLRFLAADDKTPLKFHIEKFDPVTEMALIWVKVPRTGSAVTSGAITTETIFMYYGNPSAVSGEDKAGTYDINQSLVYHFDALAQAPTDATAYQNNPATYQGETTAIGLIGNAAKFGNQDRLLVNGSPSMRFVPESGWTLSMWFLVEAPQPDFSYLLNVSDNQQSVSVVLSDLTPQISVENTAGILGEAVASSNINPNVWHHLALVISANQISMRIDGKPVANVAANLFEFNPTINIGGATDFAGAAMKVDELKVSNIARSDFWYGKTFDNQAVGSDIVIYGEDESSESSGGADNYFVGILKSVSLDGWIVIGMLGIMAVISWAVALGKAIVISRVNKDNKAFMKEFRSMSLDLASLDREVTDEEKSLEDSPLMGALFGKHDHFQSSNLYHLYHIGMHEMKLRIGRSVGAASALSPEGLQVIKASLDAGMVREQQRLNKMMVLLTIAISGGPFLGLLGTVLGVMITFAAIAISGDVNINAIAPGVSAALMTTVAGLFVAIPALFAYNYLSTRIRDLSIDMRVFVDELTAKIAEYHG